MKIGISGHKFPSKRVQRWVPIRLKLVLVPIRPNLVRDGTNRKETRRVQFHGRYLEAKWNFEPYVPQKTRWVWHHSVCLRFWTFKRSSKSSQFKSGALSIIKTYHIRTCLHVLHFPAFPRRALKDKAYGTLQDQLHHLLQFGFGELGPEGHGILHDLHVQVGDGLGWVAQVHSKKKYIAHMKAIALPYSQMLHLIVLQLSCLQKSKNRRIAQELFLCRVWTYKTYRICTHQYTSYHTKLLPTLGRLQTSMPRCRKPLHFPQRLLWNKMQWICSSLICIFKNS